MLLPTISKAMTPALVIPDDIINPKAGPEDGPVVSGSDQVIADHARDNQQHDAGINKFMGTFHGHPFQFLQTEGRKDQIN